VLALGGRYVTSRITHQENVATHTPPRPFGGGSQIKCPDLPCVLKHEGARGRLVDGAKTKVKRRWYRNREGGNGRHKRHAKGAARALELDELLDGQLHSAQSQHENVGYPTEGRTKNNVKFRGSDQLDGAKNNFNSKGETRVQNAGGRKRHVEILALGSLVGHFLCQRTACISYY